MSNIGKVIKQQRAMSGLTLRQLSEMSGVSSSHLGRIERGERFPSAHIQALLIYTGYLSTPSASERNSQPQDILGGLDPYVGGCYHKSRSSCNAR